MSAQIKNINIKYRTHYFFNDMINIGDFNWNLLKLDRNSYKTLIFITLAMLQLKKLMIIRILTVNPLYLIVNQASGFIECNSIEEKNGNKYLIFDSVKCEFLINTQNCGMESKIKLKQLIVEVRVITEKVLWKYLIPMTIFH